jgi:hypothetical protein
MNKSFLTETKNITEYKLYMKDRWIVPQKVAICYVIGNPRCIPPQDFVKYSMVKNNIYFCGTAGPFKKETWLECSIGDTTKATSIVQIRNPNNDTYRAGKYVKKYRISQNFWAAENETFFFFPLSLPRL